jgi:hypothetical protein
MRTRISIYIAALGLVAAAAQAANADVVKRGFTVGAGGTLHLDVRGGNIRVVTGGTGVAVEVKREPRGSDGDELLRAHKIDFSQSGNDVTITSTQDRQRTSWFSWNDGLRVQWNIRVPANYNIDVHTSGGNIDVTDLSGRLDAKTSGGNIDLARIRGPVSVNTSGGSITINTASENVNAKTSGGSIEITDVQGTIDADTSGGSIELVRVGNTVNAHTSGGSVSASFTRQPTGDSSLTTSGGDVDVKLAPSIRATLDAHASGGSVDSNVAVSVIGRQQKGSLSGSINGGGPALKLRSSGGSVTVRPL